jgi:TRAP-type C4-dicarboxylate transport system permease small subunit
VRRLLTRASAALALAGGALLLAAIAITVVSVVRGAGFGRPLLGDTEAVEMLMGVAVACFLPWCEIRGAPVIVDFFTQPLGERSRNALDAVMRAVAALVIAVLALRLAIGGYDNWMRERDTMFLQLPFWWGYAGAAIGMALWTATAAFVAIERIAAARRA